jgi:hypothetical protein
MTERGDPRSDENERCPSGHECPVRGPAPPAVDKYVVGVLRVVPDEDLLARTQRS